MKKYSVLLILLSVFLGVVAQNTYNNPVLNMRDGCVERWRGYYYALGGETFGRIYSSKDMLKWTDAGQGITTTEATWLNNPQWTEASAYIRVDAGDIFYRNGVFHTYFNGIGHCYAQEPAGPYKEQCLTEPFDNYGIDVQVFQDEDGEMYYVKKRNAPDPHPMTGAASNISGPEVWAFRMNSPFSRWDITEGKVQMTHQPGHPTSLNHVNFEGPEMARYRDRYYIFYAVNRMGPRSGMYEVGCAESDAPMNFNNSKKYPHPVIMRNTEDQLHRYTPLAPTAEHGGWEARYTLTEPAKGWTDIDFDDSGWTKSMGGFGYQEYDLYSGKTFTNARIRPRKTFWKTANIYIRRTFEVEQLPRNAELKLWVNGTAKIYINGKMLNTYTMNHNTYSAIVIDPALLRIGKNVLAVDMSSSNQSSTSQQFIDFGIYDTGDETPEEIMINPAQPNFIAGPNGFERWMMYKAFVNGVERNSVDRVHFYGHEAVCEATVAKSVGYRPAPSQPTIMNYLDNAIYYPFEFLDDSKWVVRNKVLNTQATDGAALILRKDDECNYRFEVPFLLGSTIDRAGVYAFYKNDNDWVRIEVGREGKWRFVDCQQGEVKSTEFDLPEKYAFLEMNQLVSDYDAPWHTITVYKNNDRFTIFLDYFNLTLDNPIISCHDKGRVGLWASSPTVSFDAIQYTNGWDEYDGNITGWMSIDGDQLESDGNNGLVMDSEAAETIAVKGDKQWNYEFSAYMQHDGMPSSGKSGFYPLWIDADNYVKAVVDYSAKQLLVEARENGVLSYKEQMPLSRKQLRQYSFSANSTYPTNTFTYDLRSESEISGIDILWLEDSYPYLNQTFDLPNRMSMYARVDGSWSKIDATLDGEAKLGKINRYTFPRVKTNQIKMILTPPSGKASRAFCTYFHEDVAANYYLRARRESDGVHIIINDEQKCVVMGEWQESSVALTSENIKTQFNGIMHYQTGGVKTTSIVVEPVTCGIGETVKLNAKVLPDNATNKHLVWVSSDPETVKVDNDGYITRKKEGEVTITAYTTDGGAVKGTAIVGSSSDITCVQNNVAVSSAVYDLQGRLINTVKPKTIYIINGKKRI